MPTLPKNPTLGELEAAGGSLATQRGGDGMPSIGESVSAQQATALQGQGYRLTGPDKFGGYTIAALPLGLTPGAVGAGTVPQERRDAGSRTETGAREGTETTTSNREGLVSRSLPPDISAGIRDYLDTTQGLASGAADQYGSSFDLSQGLVTGLAEAPGYTAEELAAMGITPEEAAKITRTAVDPITGAANNARQNLLSYYAASGGFNPGLNATMEEVQREQGRQASTAALQARLGVSEANRRAAELGAAARQQGAQFAVNQQGLLTNTAADREAGLLGEAGATYRSFPEFTGTEQTSGLTSATSSDTTNNQVASNQTSLIGDRGLVSGGGSTGGVAGINQPVVPPPVVPTPVTGGGIRPKAPAPIVMPTAPKLTLAQQIGYKSPFAPVPTYEHGGIVKETGIAKVHKGELIIPRRKVKKLSRNLLAAY